MRFEVQEGSLGIGHHAAIDTKEQCFAEWGDVISESGRGLRNPGSRLSPGHLDTVSALLALLWDSALAMEDTRLLSTVSSSGGNVQEEAPEGALCQRKTASQDNSPVASSPAPSVADPEQATREKRDPETRKLADAKAALSRNSSPPSVSGLKSWRRRGQRKNIWTVNHVEGTKLRMNKRRRPSYRLEDQEAFYRLLEDPVIQSFLEADIFLKVSDKYLLAMVVEYFGRVGLPGHLYNRIHFFLALYIASDMEEDNPTSKRSIFQFLLGKEHWPDLYKEFLKLKMEFFHAMDHRAWVTPELCEEIQAQNPHHWVWGRERQCAP
ncbi:speedy protein E4-like [Ochotona princeps]|uniref:speedy protein E4-like n=1 Tax=Ochotona princeps TaxID=9978 RepID=UPI0027150E07|nr:speedy protein E4-like [Ochotona princeps]